MVKRDYMTVSAKYELYIDFSDGPWIGPNGEIAYENKAAENELIIMEPGGCDDCEC